MTDSKTALRKAREAINNKDFEKSLMLSKNILREDKKNYMALVFLGLSLQEVGPIESAPNAFKKAIELNPSNVLAWNGLVNYYEKIDSVEAKIELIKVYSNLLKLETVKKKLIDYSQQLANLYEFGNVSEIATIIYEASKKESFQEQSGDILAVVVNLLSNLKDLPNNLAEMYEESLKYLINNQRTICAQFYSYYLNLLHKQNKIEELLDNAKKMHSMFEIDTVSLNWICKMYNESYVEEFTSIPLSKDEAEYFFNALLKLEAQSTTALLTKSILLLEENQLTECKDILQKVVTSRSILYGWILLTKCCLKLSHTNEAIQAALKADKLLKSPDNSKIALRNKLNCLIIEALSKSSDDSELNRVLNLYKLIDNQNTIKCLPHLIRANINLKNFAEAKLLLSDLKKSQQFTLEYKLLEAQLLRRQGKFEEALNILLKNNDDDLPAELWLEFGILYADLNQTDKSLTPFLKAAKLEPYNYTIFLHLGRYYGKINDLDKARRCYEKSMKLNPNCSEVYIELSGIYKKLKKWDSNVAILQNFTSGVINKKNVWAWLQLGLGYLEQESYDKAIDYLRCVIRIDQSNMHCWESLADAYLARGAYTSALKCYARAAELSDNAIYPSLQTANIRQIIGQLLEAKSDYETILSINESYIPALKGLAETCLLQAKQCFRIQRFGKARELAQLAIDKLIFAILQRNDLSCLWKLIADGCLFVAKLPEKYCCLLVPSSLIEGSDVTGNIILEIEDLYTLATRCYCKGLNLIEDNILIWHDLACCYLRHALIKIDLSEKKDLINKALLVTRHCTSTNPNSWQHWNLLGNVAANQTPSNYALAQHAFIKAVTVEKNSAVSWCNLGTLYLILNDEKLANEAFSQAQRSDPNYVNSWIGQALLAEKMGYEEAMDLFRHSTQLAFQQQGALGYAYWVCKILMKAKPGEVIYSIYNMHAVPVACDGLAWYTENVFNDSCAWNMLGMLRERMGLKVSALEAFKNSLSLSQKQNRDYARINCGRLFCKIGNYSEAIEMYKDVEAATFSSGIGLALALFKDKQYEESYNAYESTLHWLTDEETSQSDLLSALASMAYMFQGPNAAKTLLFQSIQLKRPSPWAFYATLSLGLLHKDFKLATLVLDELQNFKDRTECLLHYAKLLSYVYLLEDNYLKAIREVSKLVHRHPNQASLWLTLSSLLIQTQSKRKPSAAAEKCAILAMKMGQSNMDVTKVLCLISLASFLVGDKNAALISAQKAIHCYPNLAECWAVLIAALQITNDQKLHNSKRFIDHVQILSTNTKLVEWTRNLVK